MDEDTLRKVRAKLDRALKANRDDEALVLLEQLSAADSDNARWPHKYGDLLRKHKRIQEAVLAYADAADIYAATGFPARASAMAKTVLSLDSKRMDVLERVDPMAAQQIRRQAEKEQKNWFGPRARATQPIVSSATDKRRPSVADHSIVPGASSASGPTSQGYKHPMVLDDSAPSPHKPARPPGTPVKRKVDPRKEPDPPRNAPARETTEMARPTRAQPPRPTMQGRHRAAPPIPAASPEPMMTARDAARPMAAPVVDDDEPVIIVEDDASGPIAPPVKPADPPPPSAAARSAGAATPKLSPAARALARPAVAPAAPPPTAAARPAAAVPTTSASASAPAKTADAAATTRRGEEAAEAKPSHTPSAAPAKERVTLDRLSVPPPRWGQSNWEPTPSEGPTAADVASQSTPPSAASSPSSVPAPPVRATELAPPRRAATISWFAGELPTGQTSRLPPARSVESTSLESQSRPEASSPPAARVETLLLPISDKAVARVEPLPPPAAAGSAAPSVPVAAERRKSRVPTLPPSAAIPAASVAPSLPAASDNQLPPPAVVSDNQPLPVSKLPVATTDSQPARANLSPTAAAEILDAGELFSRALETAADLVTGPDAPSPEPEPELELEEDALEEIEPQADPVDDQGVVHAALPSELAMFPLFAELDSEALADVIASIDSIELPDGAFVLQRGELSDSLYGIVRGAVTVVGADQSYQLTLTEGDIFGESCLLKNEPRHADVRVKGELCAVRIPRRALFQVLRRKPKLAEHLLEILTRRLLGSFLLSSALFRELGVESRRALARLFEMRLFPAGTVFATRGMPMEHLCIALTGQLTVQKPGFVPIVAPAGYVFGQHTLFANMPARATVTARVNMVVLRLPAPALRALAQEYPTIRLHLAGSSTGQLTRVNL